MPTKKREVPQIPDKELDEQEQLLHFSLEAEQVDLMTQHRGWQILQRDLEEYRKRIGDTLPYLETDTKEYKEARIMYIATDRLLKLVEDYQVNRKKAVEFIDKLDNLKENIVYDVDN